MTGATETGAGVLEVSVRVARPGVQGPRVVGVVVPVSATAGGGRVQWL